MRGRPALTGSFYRSCFLLLAGVLVSSPYVHAADIGCGRDTDRSGAVDNMCPGSDTDFDGFTVAQGDCDDTDWSIQPGRVTTKGCSAGEYRTCKASGAGYTACIASATTPYCPAGDHTTTTGKSALACKYINYSTGNDSNAGTYASPWKTPNKISSNNGAKYAVQPGDAIIIMSGTYPRDAQESSAGDSTLYTIVDGTSTNPVWIVGYPGTKPIFQGALSMYNTNYNIVRDIEFTNTTANTNAIFQVTGSANGQLDVAGLYVHDSRGVRANNFACLHLTQGGVDNYVHHNQVADCFEGAQYPGGTGIYVGQQDSGERVEYNNCINTDSTPSGGNYHNEHCVYEKHLRYNSDAIIKGNYSVYTNMFLGSSGGMNRTVSNNLAVSCNTGVHLYSSAGPVYFGNASIVNNTFICSEAYNVKPERYYNMDGSTTGGVNEECGSDQPTWAASEFKRNILSSTATNFEAAINAMYRADATYTLWHTAAKWVTADNLYHSSGSSTLKMANFAANNSCATECCSQGSLGTTYTGLAAIQAAGYETGSLQISPSMSAAYISSATGAETWGYMLTTGTPTTTTTTSTSTTTSSSTTTTTTPGVAGAGMSARRRLYR